jgi:hypothetical protein
VSAHAIGNDEQSAIAIRMDREVVFVARSDHPDIGPRGVEQTHH